MNCWDLLGIEPTGDAEAIRQAYERQLKFASEEEARALAQAYREATGGRPPEASSPPRAEVAPVEAVAAKGEEQPDDSAGETLSAEETQVVREVAIQVKALMNDNYRQQDVAVWKAILCEPPADRMPVRREIARLLESQIRPLAENGALTNPVARFLGDWFEWFSLHDLEVEQDPRSYPEVEMVNGGADNGEPADQPPQMVNFWPAVIGWIVGLIILATLFGGMGGG
ncbi:J domain-containing protein [Marinobacter daepoensis]|uniref:J domain-containing protein n=1 Tax=Marinobacter daepoensis TaxID=262077 RepID=UPI000424CD05|nr:J domain-containing protein [Marinobacter daepoensis]